MRQHKKTSFAILNELNPNQSRATSPSGRVSPFRGRGFKPSSRVSSRPQSPSNDANSTSDQSKMVQFNTKTYAEKIGPSTLKGILLTRPSFSASYADLSYRDREMESYDYKTDVKHRTLIPSRTKETLPNRPFSVLPGSTNHPSPAPRRKFHNSTGDLYSQPGNTTENPKRYHKGLLEVVRNGNTSPSKIPRRKSLSSGTEKGLERRRSSVSPMRRFSITTNGPNTTNSSIIDLGTPSSNPSRSGSRISKPTTLSPIIGTPNKDSEQSAQEDDNNENLASPTKIPVRANSSFNLVARANSRAASTSNSRANSREPSPGLLGINNSHTGVNRVNSTSRIKTNSSRSETDSLRKTNKKVDEKGSSQSISAKKPAVSPRIPVKKTLNAKSTKKEPASTKKEPSSVKREPSNLKKPPASIKREGSNSKTGKSSFKRETSNLKREPSNLKREPSNLKREPSNLKRETSNLKRESSNLKREPSNLKREPSKSHLKRQSSKLVMAAVLSKNNSDSALGKKLEKQNSFKIEKRRTISESDGPVETEGKGTAAKGPGTSGRTDSKDKLIPMTKSSVVSMTTAAITAQPVQVNIAKVEVSSKKFNNSN